MTTIVSSGIFVTTASHRSKNRFMIVFGYGSPASARASSAISSRVAESLGPASVEEFPAEAALRSSARAEAAAKAFR